MTVDISKGQQANPGLPDKAKAI